MNWNSYKSLQRELYLLAGTRFDPTTIYENETT